MDPTAQLIETISTSTALSGVGKGFLEFFGVLTSADVLSALTPFKFLFAFCGVGFIVIIVYMILHTEWFNWSVLSDITDFFTAGRKILGLTNQKNIQTWNKIKKGLEKNYEAQWKLCVIEAFAFFDKTISNAGYTGNTLLDRINSISPEDVSNLHDLVKDEQIYDNIVSNSNYKLEKNKTEEIINDLEHSLIQLEAL